MAQFEKYFTVDEANALLPELRQVLAAVRDLRDQIANHYEAATPVLKLRRWDSGGSQAAPYTRSVWLLNARLQWLARNGIQLKDLDRGLVDFPSWRGDEEVLLCWHLGEDEIRFWHDLESGFRGRQPL